MIRIFIADDHTLFVEGIKHLLANETDIECIGEASNGKLVKYSLPQDIPDILLLDINMPEIDGIEICKWATDSFPDIGVIGLTSLDNASFIQQMMKAGAKGYLLKDTSKQELITAIREVHKGNTYIAKEVERRLLEQVFRPNEQQEGFIPVLTRREKQILLLIAEEYTTSEISDALNISANTVETHRRNLLSKLGARNVAGLIKTAINKGLLN